MISSAHFRALAAILWAVFIATFPVRAGTDYTVATSSGNWSDPASWSPGGPPTSADGAIINQTTALFLDSNFTIDALTVNAYTGPNAAFSGGSLIISSASMINGGITFKQTTTANGLFTVNGGTAAVQGGTLVVNNDFINNGAVSIDGSGSSLNVTGNLFVGYNGTGTLTISNGGTVNVGGGSGTVTLANTTESSIGILNIGAPSGSPAAAGGILNAGTVTTTSGNGEIQFNTTGTLSSPYFFTKTGTSGVGAIAITGWTVIFNSGGYNVLVGANTYGGPTVVDGGTLELRGGSNTSPILIGESSGDNGTLLITNGCVVTNGDFTVGDFGTGTLKLTGGSTLTGTNGYLGYDTGGIGAVTVDGAGSSILLANDLNVGNNGTGTLSIINGGHVTVTNGVIGINSGSLGTVTVNGSGSVFNALSGYLGVGAAHGTGNLTIANGGTVNVASGAQSVVLGGDCSDSVGTLNIGAPSGSPAAAGGILNAATVTTGPGSGTVQFNTDTSSGSYYFTTTGTSGGSAIVISGPTQVVNTAGFNVLTGANTYTGSTTINGGTLSVSSLADGCSPSGIGKLTNDAGNLVLNGGTLQYTGGTAGGTTYTNRLFTIGDSGTIDASGAGAISFTRTGNGSNVSYLSSGKNATLTLTGTNTGSNTIAPSIGDPGTGYSTSLIKSGLGTWVLTGANTYSGGTTVDFGTLSVTNGGSIYHPFADIYVGRASGDDGTLSITNGGSVTSGGPDIGGGGGGGGGGWGRCWLRGRQHRHRDG